MSDLYFNIFPMNKLIELLNEYEAKRHKTSIVAEIRKGNEDRLSYLEMNWNYSELLCISKGYEFIKWLVENYKIDFDKLEDNSDWYFIDLSDNYLEILALLSIQDNPIEFLVSILK